MKKKGTKILALSLAAALTVGVTAACGGGNNSGNSTDGTSDAGNANATSISFYEYGGTASFTPWLKNAIKRFEEANKDKEYEAGKKGVKVSTVTGKDNCKDSLPESDIIMNEDKASVYLMSSKGWLADIDDLVKEINAKVNFPQEVLYRGLGVNDKYYGLPSYSYDVGISYSIDTFENYNFYIAKPGETNVEAYNSSLTGKTVNFVGSKEADRSCGPDGKYDTYDDGLPSSLEEFIALCQYMKKSGVYPFAVASKDTGMSYGFMLVDAIWSGLAGTEAMKNVYCNWTDAEVEVVKRDASGNPVITSQEMISGGNSGIMKPETETIKFNDENGYRMYDMSARYYALQFFNLAYNEGWFGCVDSLGAAKTQEEFLFTGANSAAADNTCGMLIDSSFWYGEATASGALNKFKSLNEGKEARVSIMPMPVQIEGQVTENNGKKPTILDVSAALFVNKRVENNEGVFNAVKDFIRFLYSDAELKAFTETSKLKINATYSFDKSALGDFYARADEIEAAAGEKVYSSSNNLKFLKNRGSFSLIWDGYINYFNNYHTGTYAAMKDGMSAKDIFKVTLRDKAGNWDTL